MAAVTGCGTLPGYEGRVNERRGVLGMSGSSVVTYDEYLASQQNVIYEPRLVSVTPELLHHDMKVSAAELRRPPTDNPDAGEHQSYRLGTGDIVKVVVYGYPELNNPGFSSGPGVRGGTSARSGGAAGQRGGGGTGQSSAGAAPMLAWLVEQDTAGGAALAPSPLIDSDGARAPKGGFVQGQPVSADGTIYVPHVGPVEARGRTLSELRQAVSRRLSGVITQPAVDIQMLQYRSKYVYVSVEEAPPCAVPVTDVELTALDALTRCDTLALLAGQSADIQRYARQDEDRTGVSPEDQRRIRTVGVDSVLLFRDGRMQRLNLNKLYAKGETVSLQPGDRLRIDDHNDQVFMVGEFRIQRAVPYSSGGISLIDAIADAGGVVPESGEAQTVYVLRDFVHDRVADHGEGDDSSIIVRPKVYAVDLDSPQGFILATHFRLNPRDVVFAASAPLMPFNRAIDELVPELDDLLDNLLILTNDD
ncbi:polysaccharide biosynthesis/export family protein [Salinisphaera orenii]|nr:polysaccharide biosynthesis/export family protein [Salinisphaera halophila]